MFGCAMCRKYVVLVNVIREYLLKFLTECRGDISHVLPETSERNVGNAVPRQKAFKHRYGGDLAYLRTRM